MRKTIGSVSSVCLTEKETFTENQNKYWLILYSIRSVLDLTLTTKRGRLSFGISTLTETPTLDKFWEVKMKETVISRSDGHISFETLPEEQGLPFPLFLHPAWRAFLGISLLVTLVFGAKLRLKIISYIKSPETKLGPINYLIVLDQINGLFLAGSIVMRITFLISPEPMSKVVGDYFCNVANTFGAVYIAGSYLWSCCIALFRVLFVKAQDCLKEKFGVKNLLIVMIFFGVAQIFPFSILLLLFDNENSTFKLCSHISNTDLEILDAYKVFFPATYKKLTKF